MSRLLRSVLRHGVSRGLPSRAGFTPEHFHSRGTLPSRREFLAASAATLALATTGGCLSERTSARKLGSSRVVVIGAGLAGLACADELTRSGLNVVVFEAESRVGGRVDTDRQLLPGAAVERGGQLVGTNHPTWRSLASRFKLPLVDTPSDEGEHAVVLDGRVYRGKEADALYTEVDSAVERVVKLAEPLDPLRPYLAPNAAELDAQSYAQFVGSLSLSELSKRVLFIDFEADNGVSAQQGSLLAYLSMVKGGGLQRYYTDSELLTCTAGSDALATALAAGLADRVRRGTLVTGIDRVARTVTTRSVATGETTTWPADAVVLAIPPTRWFPASSARPDAIGRDRGIYFNPALPPGLASQMGRNTKLVAVYPRPIWKAVGVSSEVTLDGPVQSTWIAARAPSGNTDGEVALTLFSGGSGADRMREFPAPHRAARGTVQLDQLIPEATSAIQRWAFYDWPGDPRTRGSYTFPAPGHVTRFGPSLVDGWRASPESDVLVHFAGEHTSYAFPGYMEGALSSGVRVAGQVIRSMLKVSASTQA